MKKILVTGAVGQIGRFVVRSLIDEKLDLIALDKRDYVNFPNVDVIHAEITKKDDLAKYASRLKDVDVLIHLASLITNEKDVIKNGPSSIDLNVMGTINLLQVLPNIEHICFSSTYMVYGTPISNPVGEDQPTDPNNIYGASKLATEKFLQIFAKQQEIDVSILRMMGVYNLEKPYAQAISTFIKNIATNQSPVIFGTGEVRRNHIYIDDVVESILTCINNPKSGVFNIGGPESPSNLELIDLINEKMGKKIKPVFKDSSSVPYDFIVDISRARTELGFVPKVGISEGITKTIERFLKVGW